MLANGRPSDSNDAQSPTTAAPTTARSAVDARGPVPKLALRIQIAGRSSTKSRSTEPRTLVAIDDLSVNQIINFQKNSGNGKITKALRRRSSCGGSERHASFGRRHVDLGPHARREQDCHDASKRSHDRGESQVCHGLARPRSGHAFLGHPLARRRPRFRSMGLGTSWFRRT